MDDTTPRPSENPDGFGPDGAAPGAVGPAGGTADVAFARLQRADPAADVVADAALVRAVLASTVGAVVAPAATVRADTTESVDVLVVPADASAAARAARARRAPRWLQVAAAVAGVVVVAGGGYAVGASRPAVDETASVAEPAVDRDGAGPAVLPAPASGQVAPAESSSFAGWWGGRTVFHAEGLSDEGGSADAWALDAAAVFSKDTAARLAAALGVEGEPQLAYGSWTVGVTDGTGPFVTLSADSTASVGYSHQSIDRGMCLVEPVAEPAPDLSGAGVDSSGGTGGSAASTDAVSPPAEVDPALRCAPERLTTPPTSEAAIAQAQDLMRSLGVDPADYEFSAVSDTAGPYTTVTAEHVLDGRQTGVVWSVTSVPDGVVALWGSLAPLVDLGTYDVVSPQEAVERLGDLRFGGSPGGIMPLEAARDGIPVPAFEPGVADDVAPPPDQEPTLPPVLLPGSKLLWPVRDVTIVSAHLGVALTTLPDGGAVLAPMYELADADGVTWTVIAVVEDQLDFSSR